MGVERLEKFLRKHRLRWLGHEERTEEEWGLVKKLHLEADGTKKEGQKRDGKVLKCDIIARGLQRLEAHDCKRWQLDCKNRLTAAYGEHLLGYKNKRKHIPEAKWW